MCSKFISVFAGREGLVAALCTTSVSQSSVSHSRLLVLVLGFFATLILTPGFSLFASFSRTSGWVCGSDAQRSVNSHTASEVSMLFSVCEFICSADKLFSSGANIMVTVGAVWLLTTFGIR